MISKYLSPLLLAISLLKQAKKNKKERVMSPMDNENQSASRPRPPYRFELTRFTKYMIKNVSLDKFMLFSLYVRYGYVPGVFICYYTQEYNIIFIRARRWTNNPDDFCQDREWKDDSTTYLDEIFVPNTSDYPVKQIENIELTYKDETQEPKEQSKKSLCDKLIKNLEEDIKKYAGDEFHFYFYITPIHQELHGNYQKEVSQAIIDSDILRYACQNWIQSTVGYKDLNIYFDYTRGCFSPDFLPIKRNIIDQAKRILIHDETPQNEKCNIDKNIAEYAEKLEKVADFYEEQFEILSTKLLDMGNKLLEELQSSFEKDGMDQMQVLLHTSRDLSLMSFELMRVKAKRLEILLK